MAKKPDALSQWAIAHPIQLGLVSALFGFLISARYSGWTSWSNVWWGLGLGTLNWLLWCRDGWVYRWWTRDRSASS